LVRRTGRRHRRIVTELARAAGRTIDDAGAILANFTRIAEFVGTRIDAGVRREVAIRSACLPGARARCAWVRHTRTIMANVVAPEARNVGACIDHALSGIGTVIGADLPGAARHAITRILAPADTLAYAHGRHHAIGICRRAGRRAQDRVVGIEHGFLGTIAAIVGNAILTKRHAVFARYDVLARLSRRTGEFASRTRRRTRAHAPRFDA